MVEFIIAMVMGLFAIGFGTVMAWIAIDSYAAGLFGWSGPLLAAALYLCVVFVAIGVMVITCAISDRERDKHPRNWGG